MCTGHAEEGEREGDSKQATRRMVCVMEHQHWHSSRCSTLRWNSRFVFVLLQSFFYSSLLSFWNTTNWNSPPFFFLFISPLAVLFCLSVLETIVSTIVFVCVAKKTNKKKRKRDPIKS